ncbi:MAG: hypothetical protein JNM47_06235 [Hyphomonadaceae bacterium]|nr:hypothetical protein [Hyphomonadaceae bacterium]
MNRRTLLVGFARTLVLAGAMTVLPGCFASREPLVTARESVRVFGNEGYAKRVAFDRMGGGPLADAVIYRWTGDAYEIVSLANPRERITYRVAPLDRVWLVAQVIEGGRATYGIAKIDGPRVWTYAPECRGLNDADRAELKIEYADSQTCLVTDRAQLRAALQRSLQRGLHPQGYYEVVAPPVAAPPARPQQGPPR